MQSIAMFALLGLSAATDLNALGRRQNSNSASEFFREASDFAKKMHMTNVNCWPDAEDAIFKIQHSRAHPCYDVISFSIESQKEYGSFLHTLPGGPGDDALVFVDMKTRGICEYIYWEKYGEATLKCRKHMCGNDKELLESATKEDVDLARLGKEMCPSLVHKYKKVVEEGYTYSREPDAYTFARYDFTAAPHTLPERFFAFTTKFPAPQVTETRSSNDGEQTTPSAPQDTETISNDDGSQTNTPAPQVTETSSSNEGDQTSSPAPQVTETSSETSSTTSGEQTSSPAPQVTETRSSNDRDQTTTSTTTSDVETGTGSANEDDDVPSGSNSCFGHFRTASLALGVLFSSLMLF